MAVEVGVVGRLALCGEEGCEGVERERAGVEWQQPCENDVSGSLNMWTSDSGHCGFITMIQGGKAGSMTITREAVVRWSVPS